MNGNPEGKMRSFTGGKARQLDDGSPNSPGRDFSGICDADVGIWDENFERSTYFTRTAPLVVPSLLLCSRSSVHSAIVIVAFGTISGVVEGDRFWSAWLGLVVARV